MQRSVIVLAFFTITIASIVGAEESIVERLQNTGVKVHVTPKDDVSKSKTSNYLDIPYDWKCTDQSVSLVREWISAFDTPVNIYVAGPRDTKHVRIEKLEADFPLLTVHRAPTVFLGITCSVDPFACKVSGLVEGSCAESAGLMKSDKIIGVNAISIKTFKELRDALLDFLPGEVIVIHVKRDSQDLNVNVKLAPFPLRPT